MPSAGAILKLKRGPKVKPPRVDNELLLAFAVMRRNALKRSLLFTLSFEEFKTLRSSPCRFGGATSPAITIGIDRADSSVGYLASNCIPCCWKHNLMKGKWFSEQDMLAIVSSFPVARDCADKFTDKLS